MAIKVTKIKKSRIKNTNNSKKGSKNARTRKVARRKK